MRLRYGVGLALLVATAAWLTTTGVHPFAQSWAPDHPVNRSSSGPTESTLPPSRSLGDRYAFLAGQAAMGNTAAAVQLFNEQSICQGVATLKNRLHENSYESWLAVHALWLASRSAEDQAGIKQLARARYKMLDENRELCTHVDASFNDGRIYDSALQAAEDGDTVATACLVEAPWPTRPMTDDDASTFDKQRLELAGRDIQHGSWLAVAAMLDLYSSTGSATQMPGHSHLNRYDELRMRYLQQIGRQQAGASNEMADHRVELAEINATPEEIERARGWAIQMYATSFAHVGPPPPPGEDPCLSQSTAP